MLTNLALIVSVINRRCSLFNRIILSVNTQVPRCAEVEARKWITEPGRVIITRACVCIALIGFCGRVLSFFFEREREGNVGW